VLAWAFDTFGNEVAISSAFGAEGMALIDMAWHVRRNFRVFTIDTDFLFPETYSLIDRDRAKIRNQSGTGVFTALARGAGANSWCGTLGPQS
jgi:3'-phosphoadenosine 5'-phosphosulfate sulfotransferase (PAPS reductase)/FAD synthetase